MRFGLKWRIFVAYITLSLTIVICSMLYTNHVVERAASRHGELQGVFTRYEMFQRSVSKGHIAAIDAWAISSTRLREALAKGDDATARPLIDAVETALQEDLQPDFM